MRRAAVLSGLLAALVLPGTAAAHVAPGAPVATDFSARIRGLVPPAEAVRAAIVDGDRQLSLRVGPTMSVTIPGALGEPLLRFSPEGVFVNRRSVTAQSDRIAAADLRPVASAQAPPLWGRLTTAHTYRWHEHRLHALEPLAAGRASEADLGRWSVPLVIDGRRYALMGTLRYRPPGATWAWIAGACGIAVLTCALVAAARPAWQGVTVAIAVAAVLLTGTAHRPRAVPAAGRGGLELPCGRVHDRRGGRTAVGAPPWPRGRPALHCLPGRHRQSLPGHRAVPDVDARLRADRPAHPGRAGRRHGAPRARRGAARGHALGAVRAGEGRGMNGQSVRLLVGLLALAAGIAAVVVMIVLLGRTPGPV